MEAPTRRDVLAVGTLALSSLAGCGSSGSATDAPATGDTPGSTSTAELDLREANVTAVALGESDGGAYRFDVTLYHDDAGEDGYANWWQVESLDGDRLGRRDLLHAHGTEPFTRSATVSVSDGVDCVVVRGHDRTHGYGGQAMAVALSGGETNAVEQGSERQSFDRSDCP